MAERPTTHSVAVCTLIALHSDRSSLLYKPRTENSENSTREQDVIDPKALAEHISSILHPLLLSDADASFHPSLASILRQICGPGNKFQIAAKVLFNDIVQSSKSIDSLIDLFAALRATVANGVLEGEGVMGIYVRRQCLGFDELGFDSVGRFWEAVRDYVSCAENWWDRTVNESFDPEREKDEGVNEGNIYDDTRSSNWPLAPRQVSRQLYNQCHDKQMRTSSSKTNTTTQGVEETKDFVHVEAQLQPLLEEHPELTLAHYLRFLNCVRHGERVGALEHFHRYFDYSLIQERKERLLFPQANTSNTQNNNNANSNSNSNTNSTTPVNRDPSTSTPGTRVQYAAIVLAHLHDSFQNGDLCHLATLEAVRVAQQSGDGACLAFALGWLAATNPGKSNTTSALLERGLERAAEHQLRSLYASSSLWRVRHSVQVNRMGASIGTLSNTSSGTHPAWENLSMASTDPIVSSDRHSSVLAGMSPHTHDAPTYMTNIASSREIMDILARQQLMSSGLWSSMGQVDFAGTVSQVALRCYSSNFGGESFGYLVQRVADAVFCGMGPDSIISSRRDGLSGKCSLEGPGIHEVYLNMLRQLEPIGSEKGIWHHCKALLIQKLSMSQLRLHESLALNVALHSYTPLTQHTGIKASIDSMGQHCLLLAHQKQWEEAKSLIVESLCPLCEHYQFHIPHANYLLQLVLLHLESNPNEPIAALPALLECLSICEVYSIDSLHASAMTLLASIYFKLDNPRRAKSVIKAILPSLVRHGHLFFQGEAWLISAKCTLTNIKHNSVVPKRRDRMLVMAITELKESLKAFKLIKETLHLREVYYLMANTYASMKGQKDKRNESSRLFCSMNRQVSKATSIWPTVTLRLIE